MAFAPPSSFVNRGRDRLGREQAAVEASPEFAKLSGCVIGAHNIVCRLEEVVNDLCGHRPQEPRPAPDPGTMSTIGAYETITRSHGRALILLEIVKELIAIKATLL